MTVSFQILHTSRIELFNTIQRLKTDVPYLGTFFDFETRRWIFFKFCIETEINYLARFNG
jgi:hypothetical protein